MEESKVLEKRLPGIEAHIIKATQPIAKSDKPTNETKSQNTYSEWIEPENDMNGLKNLVQHSSILPQCIKAYKNNITGFGIGIEYKEDFGKETKEMVAEYDKATQILSMLNFDVETKKLFGYVVEARETYGIAYVEVLRNISDEVIGMEFIRETPSIRKTVPLEPYVDTAYYRDGQIFVRPKKFCKYKQEVGTKTVYLREFGDPRIMDNRTGKYLGENETLDIQYQANEILEFALGSEPYGEVRWIGQVLGVDGSRAAESLNNRYFKEGRHTPLMIIVKGGTLTDDSFSKLQEYMNDIKGENGQHAFMVLESETTGNRTEFADEKQPEIDVKDLASMLQKDELFQEYLENNRKRTQSSFLLPDLYVGRTTDYNRATAQVAMEVTESQVFVPERLDLAWIINNKLIAGYLFKYVKACFKAPKITNPDDLAKILGITERAGGLSPNKAKEISYNILGEVSENYEGDWGDTPLAVLRNPIMNPEFGEITSQLEMQIQKADQKNEDSIVSIMNEVRSLLVKMKEAA